MKVLKISRKNYSAISDEAIKVLKSGGVVVVPTDTVYGLAADARNEEAVKRIYEIKGRSENKALPVFISSFEILNGITHIEDRRVQNFLRKIWPGKVTCVLPVCEDILRGKGVTLFTKNGGTIGIRMPNYDLVLSIIKKFAGPITGTSANVAGGKEHTKIGELTKEFNGLKVKPDLILDAGDLPPSKPSTVLDCAIWPPKILRDGAVSKNELEKILK